MQRARSTSHPQVSARVGAGRQQGEAGSWCVGDGRGAACRLLLAHGFALWVLPACPHGQALNTPACSR